MDQLSLMWIMWLYLWWAVRVLSVRYGSHLYLLLLHTEDHQQEAALSNSQKQQYDVMIRSFYAYFLAFWWSSLYHSLITYHTTNKQLLLNVFFSIVNQYFFLLTLFSCVSYWNFHFQWIWGICKLWYEHYSTCNVYIVEKK